ncbi:MAG: GNAT family N-acetyltransferase [Gemmatimonadota bacterium]
MAFEIRRASPADHEEILVINAEGVPGVSELDAPKLDRLSAEADPLLVAVQDGRVAAYLIAFRPDAVYEGTCFRWFREHHASFLYIDQVAVGARWRRSGAASALYSALEAEARQLGLVALTCEVNLDPPNPESMAFHDLLGFREVATLDVPDGRRVSLQVRPLPAPHLD